MDIPIFSYFTSIEFIVLLMTLLSLGRYYLHKKWQVLKKLNIQHDSPTVFKLGNSLSMVAKDSNNLVLQNKKKYGPIWGYYFVTKPRIVIHDLGMIQKIYTTEFSNFTNRSETEFLQILGNGMEKGLLSLIDVNWKRVRTTLSPTFSLFKIKKMVGIIDWCVENMIEVLDGKCKDDNCEFQATSLFSQLSMDVICSVAFGTNVNSQDNTKEEPEIYLHAKRLVDDSGFNGLFILCRMFPFFRPLVSIYNERKKHSVFMREFINRVINDRKDDPTRKNRVDLLQLMLDLQVDSNTITSGTKKGITKLEIIGNSMTMLLAGYETTGTAMACLAYNLAQHPKIQLKLQKEIDALYKFQGSFEYESVKRSKYLDMCVNENLRLYPPISRTTRIAKNEVTINGFTIPAGGFVVIPIHALSHDPDFWNDPWKFDPERMQNMNEMHPMIYQPFGHGPRNCIGMTLAMMEIKMTFCKLLHKFTFETTISTPSPPLEMAFNLTSRPIKLVNLKMTTRA